MAIILASNSPRRRQLLAAIDIDFEVKVLPGIDESYPSNLSPTAVAEYIARKKGAAYKAWVDEGNTVITADTIVICGNEILGKPHNADSAHRMLRLLSGRTHQVDTGVSITAPHGQAHFTVTTDVTFKPLSDEEIDYYVSHYKPFDKAGAYGIQEWIGYIGCTGLHGSYYNVMGLPVQRIYEALKELGVIDTPLRVVNTTK